MNPDRLDTIEKKVDKLIVLMEGIHGADGLVSQVYSNRKEIADIRKLVYKSIGVLSTVVPLITLMLRSIL